MREYQYKFPIGDAKKILNAFETSGIKFSNPVPYEYSYLKLPGVRRNGNRTLRIKEFEAKKVLDMKIKDGDGVIKKVIESEIVDVENMKKILSEIGCEVEAIIKKKRRTFKNNLLRIDMDEIDGFGNFLEIKFREDGKLAAKKLMKSLGLDIKKSDKRSISEIFRSAK